MYEDEIDLRVYVRALLKNWHWIVGAAALCALAALAVTMLQTPTYEATALVAMTKPQYVLQFDARFETVEQVQPYKAYPALARSDDVMRALLEALPRLAEGEIETVHDLREKLEADNSEDPSVLKLTASSADPEEAALIVNAWADVFAAHANAIYSRSAEQAEFFADQLERAQAELDAAERALVVFEAGNQIGLLRNRLSSLLTEQTDYLGEQRKVAYLTQDVTSLRAQLAAQSGGYTTTLADQLTALLLQVKAFNAQAETPIQLQLDNPAVLSTQSVSEQIALLDDLMTVLEDHAVRAEGQLAEVEPQILALQAEIQQAETELSRLTRARDLASETYTTLAYKVEESRIAAADEDGEVRIASRAAVPTQPAGAGKLRNTLIAGVVGGMLGVGAVFVWHWWNEEEMEATGKEAFVE